MKKYSVLLLLIVFNFSFAQNINEYKYAIVPSKFNFLKETDQYRLNTLTKLLMEKHGFTAYLDTDILPEELANNNCNKVYVEVESTGNFLSTKLKITLKDCKNNVLYILPEGKSKEKEYKVAYNEALRDAFKTLNYKYKPSSENPNIALQKEILNNDSPIIVNEPFDSAVEVFFAQPITNGFQLVDSSPKVVMKIFNTSNKNCFIALKGKNQGILISKDSYWFFEYYQNESFFSEMVNVKF